MLEAKLSSQTNELLVAKNLSEVKETTIKQLDAKISAATKRADLKQETCTQLDEKLR